MKKVPAPWELKGNGYIIAFKFPKEFTEKNSFIPSSMKKRFSAGIGSVMLIDYNESAVGPYRELLFIPGKFKFPKKKIYSITKIYVSSKESVVNGKLNWGIPKELADFKIEHVAKNKERITVSKDNSIIMDVTLHTRGPTMPFFTKMFPLSLVQETVDNIYYTQLHGKGKEKMAKIIDVSVNQKYFPNISKLKPLFTVKIENFKLFFEKPEIVRRI